MNKPVAYIVTRLLFLWRNLKKKVELDFSSLNSILFVELSKMGDVVSMLPLIQTFHDANPNARLFVAVDSLYSDIINNIPSVALVPLEGTKSIIGLYKAMINIKSFQADLTVCMSPSFRNIMVTLNTKNKFKVGYFQSKSKTTPFLFKNPLSSVGFHLKSEEVYYMDNLIKRGLNIAGSIGLNLNHNYPKFQIPEQYDFEASAIINQKLPEKSDFAVIHPFADWPYRRWEFERFISVAGVLDKYGIQSIFIGSRSDEKTISSTNDESFRKINILFGKPLSAIIGLINRAALFIGNDSGPLHIATLLGVPCIGLFGPASPDLTAPQSDRNVYLYHRVDCSPCDQTNCIRPENPCINLIETEEVVSNILKLNKEKVPHSR